MTDRLSTKQLIHVLTKTSPSTPKFTLFLGSGASVSSGVKTGGQLVEQWRESYNAGADGEDDKVEKQVWYSRSNEYGKLFEHLFPDPAVRRDFIETCIEGSSPAWGYLYLADLLENGFFNTVLTTNFDDLLNEACHHFTKNTRLLVCSHDASINHFRLTSRRPKLIKLHGDYLFDSIKNTPSELDSLETNTKEKLAWLAKEYGLIVVGYGGQDESVMSELGSLLKDPANFPNGLYWCIQKSASYAVRLDALTENPRFHFVEIDDFDSLMSAMHTELLGRSPPVIADPFKEFSDRLSHLLGGLGVRDQLAEESPRAIQRDLATLAKSLQNKTSEDEQISITLPYEFLGTLHYNNGEYDKAMPKFLQGIENGNPKIGALIQFFECLRYHWDADAFDRAVVVVEKNIDDPKFNHNWLTSALLSIMHAKQYAAAVKICDLIDRASEACQDTTTQYSQYCNKLNRLQLVLHSGEQLSEEQLSEVKEIQGSTDDKAIEFGCLILAGDYRGAIGIAREQKEKLPSSLSDWPIIQLLPTAELNALKLLFPEPAKHFGHLSLAYNVELKPPEADNPE